MAKQLNVNLAFSADSSKAKAELKSLQSELVSLINLANVPNDFKFTDEIREATVAASQLKLNLDQAINTNTGKLDLGKFQQGMQQSNMSIEKYRQSLTALGPAGEKAFVQLANSISSADMPLRTTSTLVSNLWTTMKNTARWQISSSILHGFMGAVQNAYGYAQDLNESLNNIRIVTGYNTDQMAEFAEEANNAAKALSTTTTEYTNASLIFYQQGLNTQEVKERTDVTIKLANVARQSVEETSDQLTAVWNNFAKQGDNLERYADVLTALGAATASSTAEISGGLEKFASIADMIGLSYDYAASALATITATTRQSEDVVGTALKTIFARIQGLNLGETLDDGTTLNKYSEALNKVGVSIYDQAGELKNMDAILDEMGSKWNDLSKDQQVALAQTVAGVRQYNQLVSLMDNWDFMQENISIAKNSTGELSTQADIYAESWEAARDRVTAAAEDIFDSILKDDFFITILNTTEKVLTGIGEIIDSAGGLGGVFTALSAIIFKVFGTQLSSTFDNLRLNILNLTKEGKQAALELRVSAQQEVIEMYDQKMTRNDDAYDVSTAAAQSDVNKTRAKLTQELALNAEHLSQTERDVLSYMLDQNAALGEQVIQYGKMQDTARRKGSDALGVLSFDLSTDLTPVANGLKEIAESSDKTKKSYADYARVFQDTTLENGKSIRTMWEEQGLSQDQIARRTEQYVSHYRDLGTAIDDSRQASDLFKKSADGIHTTMEEGIPSLKTFGDTMVSTLQSISSISMGLFSLVSAIDTVTNSIQSGSFEFKDLLSILMSVSMALPMIITGFKTLRDAKVKDTVVNALNVASEKLVAKSKRDTAAASGQAATAQQGESAAQTADTVTNVADSATEGGKGAAAGSKGIKDGTIQLSKNGAKLLGKIGLIAAAVAVVVGTVAWAIHQANEAERNLEKAKDAAKELNSAFDTVKASYEDFNAKNAEYQTATEAISELTKGTAAYQEAVLQANEAASALLDTNQLLKYTIEDGLIVIDEESLEEAKKAEQQALERAQAAKIAGQTNVRRAEEDLKKRDMARDLDSVADDGLEAGNILAATGAGAAAGALVGTAIPIIGTAIGAVVGGLVGLIGGAIATETTGTSVDAETDALEKLEEAYLKDSSIGQQIKDGTFDYTTIGIEDKALIASLQANGEEVSELVRTMAENTAAVNAQNDLVASQVLSDNKDVQNSKYQNEIVDIVGDSYGMAYDKAMESDWVDDWGKEGISKANGANATAKQVFDEYLKYAGLEGEGYTLTDTTGTDKNRKFVYTDKSGETHEVSLEAMQAARAAYEASGTLDEAASMLAKTFDSLAKSGSEADQALLSFLSTKDFGQANQGEFKAIQTDLQNNYTDNKGNVDYESYLENSLGVDQLSDDIAVKYGYESAQAMVDAFSEGLSKTEEAWDQVKVPKDLAVAKDVSLQTAENLEKQISQMNLGPLGEKAGQEYVEKINGMLEGINPEDQQKALAQLSEIDWSDWDALDQADQIMQGFGKDIDTTSEAWKDFAYNMQIANGASPDFSDLKNDLVEISSILDKLDFGKVIDEEDYQKLIQYQDGWKDFFVLQSDGTRKFIGDANQMKQATQENIQEQRKQLEERSQIQKNFNESAPLTYGENDNQVNIDWEEMASQKGQVYQDASGNDVTVDNVEVARNLMDSDDTATKDMLNALGYSSDVIQQMIDDVDTAATTEAQEAAQARIKEMYSRIGEFVNENMGEEAQELDEMMASTATSFYDLNTLMADGQISTEAYEKQQHSLAMEIANTAASLAELKTIQSLDDQAYYQGLLNLASQYTNCTDELEAYNQAMNTFNTTKQEEARLALEASIIIGEAADKYDLVAEEVEYQAKMLKELNPELELNAEQATQLAIQNQRMNKGLKTLVDNWEDWKKILKSTNKDTTDYAKTAVNLTKTIADLVGASDDLELSTDFFDKTSGNLELLDKAVAGSEQAINALGIAVGSDLVKNMEQLDYVITDSAGDVVDIIDITEFTTAKDTVLAGLNELQTAVLNGSAVMGDSLSDILGEEDAANWVSSLNDMALATNMTVDDMNALLGSVGMTANVTTTEVEQPVKVPVYETTTSVIEEGDPETGDGRVVSTKTVQTGTETMDGVVTVAQIDTGDDPGAPDISHVKYSGSGKVSPSITSTDSSSGSKSKKEKKKTSDIERYHTVTKEIEDLNRELSRTQEKKDQAFGQAKLPFIKEEINLIDKLIKKNKQYQAEILGNLDIDWNAIYGFGFIDENADGILDNWYEIQEKMMTDYNTAVDQFNSGEMSEAAFEEAEQKYEDFLDLVEQYEETQETLEEALDEAAALERQRIEKELEEITTEVEFEIEINQRDLDKLDRIIEKLNRSPNTMIEVIDKLGEQVGVYDEQSSWYMDGISRIRQNAANENRELTDDEQRKIWEYEDALEEINSSLDDIIETVNNSLLEEFERWNSEIDDNIARFDTYSSTIEHYSEIIKLSGRQTKDSMLLMQLQSQKTSIAMEELNAVYDKYQANVDAQKNVKEKLDLSIASGNKEDIEYWQKQYDEITKAVEESADEVAATWEEALQAASDEFDFAVEQAVQKLKDSISQFGLDGLADRYDKAKTINEQYLSDLDKEYELNKLIRQVEGSIDDTDNLNAKRDLIALLDKINKKTAEGVKLSQYDLEYMQAEYELELAKLALEEARNAKTTVRLQRGDDGNYNYVYTADQDEIANAEQNYEDKLHAIKELSQNYIDEMSDLIIQNEQELMEAIAAIDKTKFDTEEAYLAELDRITEYYYNRDTYLRTELNKAVENMGLVYGDTILGQLENCSTWEAAQQNLTTNTNQAIATMGTAWSKWKNDTETAMTMVGTSSGNLTTRIKTDANAIATATSSLASTINTQTSSMKKYIDSLIDKIYEWRDAYLSAIRAMQNTNSLTIQYDVNADYSSLMGSVEYGSDEYNLYKQYRDQKLDDPNYTGSGGNVSTARIDAFLKAGYSLEELGYKYYTDIPEEKWIELVGFKTGGYTGEWGPEGKMAYLHEKELVLDENDTKNILNAVDLVRTISQKLDQQAQIAALGFASKANAHNGTNDSQTIQVEQDVTIHAEFPNATDQNEIKEAILGLVNYTAQYVAKR